MPEGEGSASPHFASVESLEEAATLVGFEPLLPAHTAGHELAALRVFVRDHKLREVDQGEWSLEAHYGGFVLAQSKPGVDEARRLALETRYGAASIPVSVAGREGRSFALGAEPPPDDIDGRPPAVVVWADGARFYLVASTELEENVLLRIAGSLYLARDEGATPVP